MKKNIVFIGMPGSGKTTLGRMLGKSVNIDFYDVDEYIEFSTKEKISEMFLKSEEYFRNIETEKCRELSMKKEIIISTGGGVVKKKCNIDFLKQNGIIIFIDRPIEKILEDIEISKRPLLKNGREKVLDLYKERYQLYKEYSDITIINDKSLNKTFEELLYIYKKL